MRCKSLLYINPQIKYLWAMKVFMDVKNCPMYFRMLYYIVYEYVWKLQDKVLLGQKHVQ